MEVIHASILSHDLRTFELFAKRINPLLKIEILREVFEQRVARGYTSLMIAIEDNSVDIFHYIIKYSVKLNVTDEKGKTALHHAVELGREEMIETLLRNRANPNIKDISGETPLFNAVRQLDKRSVLLLFDYGADVNVTNTLGNTLLHESALKNDVELI